MPLDLTPFGFTATESTVYEVLLNNGPGTGYAIARAAGLARANAYSALEGLVTKGAARVTEGGGEKSVGERRGDGDRKPKRYRPEPPQALVAKIASGQGRALEQLSADLSEIAAPPTPTLIEIDSSRAVLRVLSHDIGRASASVLSLMPTDAYPLLIPVLRRAAAAGVALELAAPAPVALPFAPVAVCPEDKSWPGTPVIAVVDDLTALIAARTGHRVAGHWSSAPTFIAAARLAIARLRQTP